jgi:hypothetical protein
MLEPSKEIWDRFFKKKLSKIWLLENGKNTFLAMLEKNSKLAKYSQEIKLPSQPLILKYCFL